MNDPGGLAAVSLDPRHWMQRILVLEAQKAVALASLGRRSGAEEALARTEAALDEAMRQLARLGARYPLHMAAEACDLDATDYLLLQLAMLPRVDAAAAADLAALVLPCEEAASGLAAPGRRAPALTLVHAVAILGRGDDDWPAVAAALREQAAFRHGLVVLGKDDAFGPGPALRELLGWEP